MRKRRDPVNARKPLGGLVEPWDGGPVAPTDEARGKILGLTHEEAAGLSVRDWFAGQALAILTDTVVSAWSHARAADECYRYADALLAARSAAKRKREAY